MDPEQTDFAEDVPAVPAVRDSRSLLPSGRTVVVKAHDHEEEIEIRSSGGEVEVRIVLTEQGPILRLRGARLEIDSSDTVAVNCRQFEVNATHGVQLRTAGDVEVRSNAEIRLKSGGQTYIDGDYVNLNCLDRRGYHDEGEGDTQLAMAEVSELPEPAPSDSCPEHGGAHPSA
jgi:hypothetical protein